MPYCTIHNKQMFYQEQGTGEILIFLHGNTASSLLFESILPHYQGYHCILLDFLGNGKSERLPSFSSDLWFDQAQQTIAFIKQQKLSDVILIGTSGGAITAMNVVLEYPEAIRAVVADSFMGEVMLPALFHGFEEEREYSLQDSVSSAFYQHMQGDDYECIVRQDTQAILEHVKQGTRCIHKTVEELTKPVLLLGSEQDDMILNIAAFYDAMKQRSSYIQVCIVKEGEHPSICSNPVESASCIHTFIHNLK